MRKLQINTPNAFGIYIIWPCVIKNLVTILHRLTNNDQYGYKHGISTIDAVIKLARYFQNGESGN